MPSFLRTLLSALLIFSEAFCADFFVSATGSDTNPGTQAAPFKTIQKGCDSAAAGSTVFVTAGIYSERITINNSGDASNGFITLRNFNTDAVAIDASNIAAPAGASAIIWIQDKSYVRIQGLELRNYSTTTKNNLIAGIYCTGAGDHIEIRNCHVHHIANNAAIPIGGLGRDAHGIAFYGTNGTTALTNIVVDSCEVDHNTLGSSETMTFNGNVDGFQATHNMVHDNDNIGIDAIGWEKTAPKNDQARNGIIRDNTVFNIESKGNPAYGNDTSAGGIYVDGGRDTLIERNIVYGADVGIEVGVEHHLKTASGVTVRDNLIYNCVLTGIGFGGYDTRRGITENCQFLNNTLYHNDTSNSGTGEVMIQQSKNNVFKNNIVVATDQNILTSNVFAKAKSAGNVFDYNLYFCSGGASASTWGWQKKNFSTFVTYQAKSQQDAHSLFADPLFVSPTTFDFHLQTGSPAIDASDPAFAPAAGETDLSGAPRKNGSAVDLGAYEK
ncbi:MAG TPA: right-handed parallel beta-helix repeat-containing protein [Planctomycetota bacterium]|nr:right-handed parallel beta-helix repeat-containing protein [Planctomycetota bacterium]